MRKDELIAHLRAELKEELEGIIKYNEMYEAAEELDIPSVATTIYAIACDEWRHARYLRTLLLDHGESLSPECMSLWEKVEKINE